MSYVKRFFNACWMGTTKVVKGIIWNARGLAILTFTAMGVASLVAGPYANIIGVSGAILLAV